MSATTMLIGQAIDKAILVLLGDKISAEKQREIRRTIVQAIAGDITDQQAYDLLRYKDGDKLDQLLP